MSDDATMTTSEVRDLLGLGSSAAARVQLIRWRIRAGGRDTATGEKLWDRAAVETANANRHGRGARTDLRRTTTRTPLNTTRAIDYITTRHTNVGPDGTAFTHYELHAPTGSYDEIRKMIRDRPEPIADAVIHVTVIEQTDDPHVTVVAFNLDIAIRMVHAILAAGIQLIPAGQPT